MTKKTMIFSIGILMAVGFMSSSVTAQSFPTSFTYQGQVEIAESPVNENCDFRFTLWNDLAATAPANQVGATQTLNGVAVEDGVFTVNLDFGAGVFDGSERYLEISVACPSGQPYQTLSPRQEIHPTPYAQTAGEALSAQTAINADAADSVDWTNVQNIPSGFADNVDNTGSDGTDHVHSSLDAPDGDPVEAVKVEDDGSVGFGKQDAFGSAVDDQSSSGGTTAITGDSHWQSFTAGVDGRLTSIVLPLETGSLIVHVPNLFLYEGEGKNGTLLGVAVRTINANQSGDFSFNFGTPPTVLEGSVYTWALAGTTDLNFFRSESNPYPGGMAETGGDHDYNFTTRVEPSIKVPRMVLDTSGNLGVGTQSPTGRLHVTGSSGDGSVVLPSSSISSTEMVNEPGIVQVTGEVGSIFFKQTIATAEINAPASGFVWACATGDANLSFGVNQAVVGFIELQAEDSSGYDTVIRNYSGAAGDFVDPYHLSGVFPVTAGTHSFTVTVDSDDGSSFILSDTRLVLMYFPTAYGTVTSPPEVTK
ncbi:MAG: hypothetical protein H6752_21550 [Candidatus Omnitrophica bacterium]|nr:hypothetical protein [Candidatus Omnitrophota bacterium]